MPGLETAGIAEVAVKERPQANSPDEGEPLGFDDAAEAAFLADARDRGELVPSATLPAKAGPDLQEEKADERAPLPALAELVERIPAAVRETLEELYRAKFIAVRRVPAKALKAGARERKS